MYRSGRDMARYGETGFGAAGHCSVRHGASWRCGAVQGVAGMQLFSRQGVTGFGLARPDSARQCLAWLVGAR